MRTGDLIVGHLFQHGDTPGDLVAGSDDYRAFYGVLNSRTLPGHEYASSRGQYFRASCSDTRRAFSSLYF